MSKAALFTAAVVLLATSADAYHIVDPQAGPLQSSVQRTQPNGKHGGPVELPDWIRQLRGTARILEEDEEQWNGEVYGEYGRQNGQTNWKVGGKITFDEDEQHNNHHNKNKKINKKTHGFKTQKQYCKSNPDAPSCKYKQREDAVTFDEDEMIDYQSVSTFAEDSVAQTRALKELIKRAKANGHNSFSGGR